MSESARDYLGDDFDMQSADFEPESARDYCAFADYLRALPGNDPRMVELGVMLRPFLDNDPGLDGTLYPDGDATRFMDKCVPGDYGFSHDEYLDLFLAYLRRDYGRWTAHVAAHGDDAEWTLETGRPEVATCLAHIEAVATSKLPQYTDWEHYLSTSIPADRRKMCAARTHKANGRIASEVPLRRLTADDVWGMIQTAQGRCVHCQSLCLQTLPYDPETKKKLPWAAIGRRIGSVTHLAPRMDGGSNELDNLAWSCLWCNTWLCERVPGATDHGAVTPTSRRALEKDR